MKILYPGFSMVLAALAVALLAVASAQVTTCGVQPSEINFLGSLDGRRLGFYMSLSFFTFCSKTKLNVKVTEFTAGGPGLSSGAALGVCTNQDIGAMSRPWLPSEGSDAEEDYIYQCEVGDTSRSVVQIDAAIGALVLIVRRGTVADTCLANLPGLTIAQLRTMFSSTASPTMRDLHPSCPATTIRVTGPLPGSDAGVLFRNVVGFDTFNSPRYLGFANDIGAQTNTVESTVGIISLSQFLLSERNGNVRALKIQNENGRFVAPTPAEIAAVHNDGKNSVGHNHDNGKGSEYPFAYRLYFNIFQGSLLKSRPFLEYVLSAAGASAIVVNGLVPLPLTERAIMRRRLGFGNGAATPSPAPVFCFPGSATVEVQDKGTVQLSNLSIGDTVKVANNKFDRVYAFGHYDPDVVVEQYLAIHVAAKSLPALEISPNHLVFTSAGAIPASKVQVGDEMRLAEASDSTSRVVTKIETITRRGAFAPFTHSGTVVVNGFVASNYVTLDDENEALSGMMHRLGHLMVTPRRVLCRHSLTSCMHETYNDEGVATWVAPFHELSQWLVQQNGVILYMSMLPAMLIGAVLSILESATLLIAAVIAVGCIVSTRSKWKKTLV